MAKKSKEVKQWITIKGNHIPVYEGQTVDDAAKNFMKHEKKAKSSEAKEEKEKIFTVYQPSTILGDRVHTRLENISAKNEEEAIRKYKEIYPKAWDKHIAYTVNNEDGSSSEERMYKPSASEGAAKQDKTEQVTKAIKAKTTKQNSISNAKYADDEHHPTEMSKVKKGDFFKLSNKPNAKVYVRDEYDKSEKAYWCYEYEDVNNGRYMKRNKTVYTGFTY